ncbi:MAG: hypothetical protein H7281_11310, partial [Bacteriovorax sp.]|nr:hypothetical protein [Bacteriovorax sp.]
MKKNKLITFIIFLGILSSLDLHAEKAQVPCLKKDGGIGLQGLDKYDCQLARGIVKDPKIKNEFENKVNDKLAEKLSVKASERLEEITILDRYFDQIGLDFGKTENRVTRKCKLEVIASPICSPGKTPSSFQQKLKFLSSKFPSSENSIKSGKSESLFEKMRNRSNQIRGASQVSVNQCPVSGKTGHFFLESQFSDNAAEKFLEDLNNNKSDRVNAFYDAYPQFKMLKQNAGKDGSAFLKHFESEMKKYSPKDGSQKKFMEKFFFSERTQQQLTDALADKCEAIASDIKDYACKEMDHLGMTQDNAADLFEDDDNSEVDLQIAKGFSCNYKTESDEEDVAALLKGESPGARIEQFKSDRRVPKPLEVSISVDPFCKMYTCSDEKVKVMSSCQKGGPLNSDDLAKVCGDKCDLGMQRYIAFMKSLEKDIELTQGSSMSVAASDGEVKKPRGYSSFYQNFLGVEGTLIAEGKSVTPMTIAEKKAEFAERKLDLTPQTASLTQQPKEFAKIDRDDSFSRVEKPDFVSSPAPERDNDQFRRSFN